MYYHPSLFNDEAVSPQSPSHRALIQALLDSIEAQQQLQMGALEIAARLGELSIESQRRLGDLLELAAARGPQEGTRHPDARVRSTTLDPRLGNGSARNQMQG